MGKEVETDCRMMPLRPQTAQPIQARAEPRFGAFMLPEIPAGQISFDSTRGHFHQEAAGSYEGLLCLKQFGLTASKQTGEGGGRPIPLIRDAPGGLLMASKLKNGALNSI